MYLIRPVREADLDGILALAHLTTFGLTTLPRDRELLARRVAASLRAFEQEHSGEPGSEAYLFVMEEAPGGQIVGTSGIVAKVGGFKPFYAYRIEVSVHESVTLGRRKEIPVLHLVEDHDGPCEIGSLFLHPDHRRDANGLLLSLARFLFMADRPERFAPVVIAEMRGVIDERGRSAFWDALGSHFFELEFPKADYLSVVNSEFIGDLMPRHPIYVPLLPAAAREVIGEVHPATRGARHILEREGFRMKGMVDIFEGGPILACDLERIGVVGRSEAQRVGGLTDVALPGERVFVCNARTDFRACVAAIEPATSGGVLLDRETAMALEVNVGDLVRYVTPRPDPASVEALAEEPT